MSDPIDPAIVEVAAKAIDGGTHEFRAGSPDWRVPFCRCGWKASAPYAVAEFDRHIAELALEAAAPLIAARAWDEAIANLIYPDGTPVEIIANDNPYRADALEARQS